MSGNASHIRGRDAIVLFGVSGSGKSTIGEDLAPAIGAAFLEGDAYHSPENIAKMHAGTPLSDADRWPWLDSLGRAVGDQLDRGRCVVVACSALRRAYREALGRAARHPLIFIQLTIDPAVLAGRMQARQHFMPVSLLQSQLATLEPLAQDEIGTEIIESGSPDQTVEAIRRWLTTKGAA